MLKYLVLALTIILIRAQESVPPSVSAINPPPGSVSALTAITVTFSKAVTGVKASDLLVNGEPSSGVTGSGSVYSFTFPNPGPGVLQISWDSLGAIADGSDPSNHFDTSAKWLYNL